MPNPNIPDKCNACGEPLLLENLFVEDGCPCNSALGVNFRPTPCAACGVPCSRPGHRLRALFGVPVVDATAAALPTGNACGGGIPDMGTMVVVSDWKLKP